MPRFQLDQQDKPSSREPSVSRMIGYLFRAALVIAALSSIPAAFASDASQEGQQLPAAAPPTSNVDPSPSPSDVAPSVDAADSEDAGDAKQTDAAPVIDVESVDSPTSESEPPTTTSTLPADCQCQHELWQVNTRHMPCCCTNPTPKVFRYDEQACRWNSRCLADLTTPFNGIVIVFAHGNRMPAGNILQRGMMYYRCLTGGSGPKVRFVLWSWPSDQIKGPLKDIRTKAHRADCEGAYLAWAMDQLPEGQPISLIGYSYGARVVCSSLHYRSHLGKCQFQLGRSQDARVVITAPAMSSYDLASRGKFCGAMTAVDRMLLLYNTSDPILKRYRIVERRSKPTALGYTGLRWAIPGGTKVRQIDCAPVVGKSHYEPNYLHNPGLLAEMRRCLLWEPMP